MPDKEKNVAMLQESTRGSGSGAENALLGEAGSGSVDVGARLRMIRSGKRLSIRALAEMSGLNVNTLSLIENGKSSPSVSTLQQLAQALQVPITEFFETNDGDQKVVFQKNGVRPRANFAHGVMEDLGAGMSRFGAEPMIVTLEAGADSGRNAIVHTGREFVYCLEGQMVYSVDGQDHVLEPGDSLLFEAYLPHLWKNIGKRPARILLVLCPLDARDQPTERHFSY
ncbi:MAG: cupin domain-containing protein [Anaerolineales bacterium]